ncbi:MAG: hypothetical protein JW820_07215 [Spirochaetales bacterium]|nr:hypothetical protein [Spirochaetales bacterium]
MNKMAKVLCVALILLTVAALGSFAAGGSLRLGLEFGNPTAVLIVRPGNWDFKVGWNFATNGHLFLSTDYRIINAYQLVDFLHVFLGVGAYGQLYFEPTAFQMGGRLPIGLQAFLLDSVLEIFVEAVPTLQAIPAFGWGGLQGYVGFTLRVR